MDGSRRRPRARPPTSTAPADTAAVSLLLPLILVLHPVLRACPLQIEEETGTFCFLEGGTRGEDELLLIFGHDSVGRERAEREVRRLVDEKLSMGRRDRYDERGSMAPPPPMRGGYDDRYDRHDRYERYDDHYDDRDRRRRDDDRYDRYDDRDRRRRDDDRYDRYDDRDRRHRDDDDRYDRRRDDRYDDRRRRDDDDDRYDRRDRDQDRRRRD